MPTDFDKKNEQLLFEGDEQTAQLIWAQAQAPAEGQGPPIAVMRQQCACRERHGGLFVRNNCDCR